MLGFFEQGFGLPFYFWPLEFGCLSSPMSGIISFSPMRDLPSPSSSSSSSGDVYYQPLSDVSGWVVGGELAREGPNVHFQVVRNGVRAQLCQWRGAFTGSDADPNEPALLSHRERLVRLVHPHLATIHDLVRLGPHLYTITTPSPGGSLLDRLLNDFLVSQAQAALWFRQACEAVQHLHRSGIIHGAIHPQSFRFDADGVLRLGCLHLSRLPGVPPLFAGFRPSEMYTAPELIGITPPCSLPGDIWSLGILLFALLSRMSPWQHVNTATFAIARPQLVALLGASTSISPEASSLIQLVLVGDPSQRPTAAAILAHAWLSYVPSATTPSPVPAPSSDAIARMAELGFDPKLVCHLLPSDTNLQQLLSCSASRSRSHKSHRPSRRTPPPSAIKHRKSKKTKKCSPPAPL